MNKPASDSNLVTSLFASRGSWTTSSSSEPSSDEKVPIERVLEPPSMQARYTCAAILVCILGIWGKFAFIDEANLPNGRTEPIVHSGIAPLGMTCFYLISLPLLRLFTNKFLSQINVKVLLHETMILYNVTQVLLNGWMVYHSGPCLLGEYGGNVCCLRSLLRQVLGVPRHLLYDSSRENGPGKVAAIRPCKSATCAAS